MSALAAERFRPPGAPALRLALATLLFGGTAVVLLHDWFGFGGDGLDEICGGYLYDAVVLAAGLACLLRSRAADGARGAWLLLGAGILCWGLGEVYWTAYIDSDPSAPYPSPADALYLAFYPLAYAGLALLVRTRTHELDWRLWTDGLIAALGTAALGVAFVFDFVADHTTGSAAEVATSLAYPLGDVALLAVVVGVIALTDWRPGRAWLLLLVGLGFQGAADIAYTLQATGGIVPAGSWIDPLYLLSAAFLGALLWQPMPRRIETPATLGSRRELMVPAIFGTVMVGLFAMQYFGSTSGLSAGLWVATMAAVIARLALSARQNRRLLELAQTDSLTGLGNRGRLQVELPARIEAASDELPLHLLLFDLNGFKRYNDTFGHPAGDELLIRLGAALRAAVGANGTAYRIGGDEFCVLLSCSRERRDEVTWAAAEALSARGSAYDVSCAWGAVEIPSEEHEMSAALQLADVRMYAQKESRRLADAEPGEKPLEGAADFDARQLRVRGARDQHRGLV